MTPRALALAGTVPALLAGMPAHAHSFGQVYNLPVPVWLYVFAAAAALALSFLVVAWFVTARPAAGAPSGIALGDTPLLRRIAVFRPFTVLRAGGVLLLVLCIATGLFGTADPYRNFNMTFFWIVFVLGFAYFTALAGDWYALMNPWAAIARALDRAWTGFTRGRLSYPAWLGDWPAVALYMAFIWIELFGGTGPRSLAWLLLAYLALNLAGVGCFGATAWFRHCEFLSVFFRLLAKMAPVEVRPAAPRAADRLRLRAPFTGALEEPAGSAALLVFVLFMLSSTAFDGLRGSLPWVKLFWVDLFQQLQPWIGTEPLQAYPVLRRWYLAWETAALLLSPFLYLALYVACIALARRAARSALPVRELALRFAFTLLPIALVYNVAHYYTLVQTQGVVVLRLVSDPFGFGWNLFGTAGWLRAPIIPDAGFVWHVQVALIVAGHVVSVYLAHLEALRTFASRRAATLSQLPMLCLMMAFTGIGLWILSLPLAPPPG